MSDNGQSKSLEQELAELEPVRASEDFTGRVLAELETRQMSTRSRESRPRAVALATLVAGGLGLGVFISSRPGAESEIQEDQAIQLRQEYESLQEELAALRSLAAQPPPVLYLGGNRQVDLVLDLGQTGPEASKLDIRPAANLDPSIDPVDRPPQ